MVRFSDLLGGQSDAAVALAPEPPAVPEPSAAREDLARPAGHATPSPFAELLGPIATLAADAVQGMQTAPDPVPALEAAFLSHRAAAELGDLETAIDALVVADGMPGERSAPDPDVGDVLFGIDDDILPRMRKRRRRS